MKNVISSISLASALALSAGLAVPANAQTITLQSLEPQVQTTSHVAVSAGCRTPNADAAVDGTAFFEMPVIPQEQGVSGTSGVVMSLSATGALVSESIRDSSGNRLLDAAALRSARMTRFAPEIRNCASVGGTYLYSVIF